MENHHVEFHSFHSKLLVTDQVACASAIVKEMVALTGKRRGGPRIALVVDATKAPCSGGSLQGCGIQTVRICLGTVPNDMTTGWFKPVKLTNHHWDPSLKGRNIYIYILSNHCF